MTGDYLADPLLPSQERHATRHEAQAAQPLQHRIGCSVIHIRPSVLASPLQRAIAMYYFERIPGSRPESHVKCSS
jgi:hypothetical protein